jgi:hypothetical protein
VNVDACVADRPEDIWNQLQQKEPAFIKDNIPVEFGGAWSPESLQGGLERKQTNSTESTRRVRPAAPGSMPSAVRRKVRQDVKRRMDALLVKMEARLRTHPPLLLAQ